ncbi:hypothetical protein Tco_0027463 [Tanacetum coccineum]
MLISPLQFNQCYQRTFRGGQHLLDKPVKDQNGDVLAHAPIYAVLDKYVESLKLGKNRPAFVQGEVPAKMEDLGLFTIPYGVGVRAPYYARKDFLDCHLPGEWEIARDTEINPLKDTLMFKRMVEFLGAIPINLKSNMRESECLIENTINWDKPLKNGDGAWHAKIRLIDPDGKEFTKTLQSIPTTKMLSERDSPKEIIDFDHFYDS